MAQTEHFFYFALSHTKIHSTVLPCFNFVLRLHSFFLHKNVHHTTIINTLIELLIFCHHFIIESKLSMVSYTVELEEIKCLSTNQTVEHYLF